MMVIMLVIFKFCPRIQPTDAIILPMRARYLPNPLCCGLLFLPRNAVSPPRCCRITNNKNMHPPLTWACFSQCHSAKVDRVGRILERAAPAKNRVVKSTIANERTCKIVLKRLRKIPKKETPTHKVVNTQPCHHQKSGPSIKELILYMIIFIQSND